MSKETLPCIFGKVLAIIGMVFPCFWSGSRSTALFSRATPYTISGVDLIKTGLWGRISCILGFTCLYGVLFAKEAQTLFQHRSEKWKPFGVLQFDCICLGSVFSGLGEGFIGLLISLVLMEFSNIFLTRIVISNLCAVLRFSFFRLTRGSSNQPSHK